MEGRFDVIYEDKLIHDFCFKKSQIQRYAGHHNAEIDDVLTWKMRKTNLLCPRCGRKLYNCQKDNPARQQFYCWKCNETS